MDKTDIREEMEKRPQEIMQWFSPTTQKKLDVRVRLQEDFGNPRQPATDQVACAEHMSLEKLEMKYQLAKLFMYRRLIQKKFVAMEREKGKSTCIITEITDDKDTLWYYRLIPCCAGTQKPKVKKSMTKKKSTGGSGLFAGIRKFFCRRSKK